MKFNKKSIGLLLILVISSYLLITLVSNNSQHKKLARSLEQLRNKHFAYNNKIYEIAGEQILNKLDDNNQVELGDPKLIAINQLQLNKDKLNTFFKDKFNQNLTTDSNLDIVRGIKLGDVIRSDNPMQRIYLSLGIKNSFFSPETLSFTGDNTRFVSSPKASSSILTKLSSAHLEQKFQDLIDVAVSNNKESSGNDQNQLVDIENNFENTKNELNGGMTTEQLLPYVDNTCLNLKLANKVYIDSLNLSHIYMSSATLNTFVIAESASQTIANKNELSGFLSRILPISQNNFLNFVNRKTNNNFNKLDILYQDKKGAYEGITNQLNNKEKLKNYCNGNFDATKQEYIQSNIDDLKTQLQSYYSDNNNLNYLKSISKNYDDFSQNIYPLKTIFSSNLTTKTNNNLTDSSLQFRNILEGGTSFLASTEMRTNGGHPVTRAQYKEVLDYRLANSSIFSRVANRLKKNYTALAHHLGSSSFSYRGFSDIIDSGTDDNDLMVDENGVVVYGFTLDELKSLNSTKPSDDLRKDLDLCLTTTNYLLINDCQKVWQYKEVSSKKITDADYTNYSKYMLECHIATAMTRAFIATDSATTNFNKSFYTNLTVGDQKYIDNCLLNQNSTELDNKLNPIDTEKLDTSSALLIERLAQNDKMQIGDDADSIKLSKDSICNKYITNYNNIYSYCNSKKDSTTYIALDNCFDPSNFGAKFDYPFNDSEYLAKDGFVSEYSEDIVNNCLSSIDYKISNKQQVPAQICNNFENNYPNLYKECVANFAAQPIYKRTLPGICFRASSQETDKLSNILNSCLEEASKLNKTLDCSNFNYDLFNNNLSTEEKRALLITLFNCDQLKYPPRYNFSLFLVDSSLYDNETEYLFNLIKEYKKDITIQLAKLENSKNLQITITTKADSQFSEIYNSILSDKKIATSDVKNLHAYQPIDNKMIEDNNECTDYFSQGKKLSDLTDEEKNNSCQSDVSYLRAQPNTFEVEVIK